MFDHKITAPVIAFFILLLIGCISYAEFSGEKTPDQSSEDVENDTSNVSNESSSPPQAQDYTFWHGLWDSWNYPGDEFNMVKVPNPAHAEAVLDDGKNVFVSFSHRWKRNGEKLSRQQWRSIIAGWESTIARLDPDRTIIMIQDEPLGYSGFTLEEIKFLYNEFKSRHPNHKFGYSFTRNSVRQKIPHGLTVDVAILPMYLFEGETTKQEFDSYFDEHISIAREKMDADIFIIGQGFYSTGRFDWTQPPTEAAYWYAEAIQRNKVKGIVWWLYSINRDDTIGLEDMPEYFENVKRLQ